MQQTNSGASPGCYGSGDDDTHQFWRVKAYVVSDPDTWKQTIQGNLIIGVRDDPRSTQTGDCGTMDLTGCQKRDEKICDHNNGGCIYTFKDYHATGLIPIGSCYYQSSPNTGAVFTFCADGTRMTWQSGAQSGVLASGSDMWWNIYRTYNCEAGKLYDFTGAEQRTAHIQNTLNAGAATLTYQDVNPETGETKNYSTSLPPREDVDSCEQSCRVKIPVQDTQASLSGTTDDYRTTVNSYEFVIKKCADNVCPVGTGEILVQNCGCTSYFNESASMLQVIHDAGRDMICSRE
jgi:hypothetical protein